MGYGGFIVGLGVILVIVGIMLLIIGIIWWVNNNTAKKAQSAGVWALIIFGALFIIVGAILALFGAYEIRRYRRSGKSSRRRDAQIAQAAANKEAIEQHKFDRF